MESESTRENRNSCFIDEIIEENDFLLEFVSLLMQFADNSDDPVFDSYPPMDDKITQLGKSVALLLHFVNGCFIQQLSSEDFYYIVDKMYQQGYIVQKVFQNLSCKNYKSDEICLEMLRSVKIEKTDWPIVFIKILEERVPNISTLNGQAKGWKVRAEASCINASDILMLEDTVINKEINVPDDASFVSSLTNAKNDPYDDLPIVSRRDHTNIHNLSENPKCLCDNSDCTPHSVFDKSFIFSKASHPEIWKHLDILGILDLSAHSFNKSVSIDIHNVECYPRSDKVEETYDNKSLSLEEFQEELTDNALQQKNTIIYAPTGSGKTIVAAHIIIKHLEKNVKVKPIAFLATTVHLVYQQYERLKKYLPNQFKIMQLTGESEQSVNLHLILPRYNVFVMTPKILENHFRKQYLNITNFSMIVFDECHHTHKEDIYANIMYYYLKSKKSRPDISLPQIIGLTASISIQNANSLKEAVDNILVTLANLDAECISSVQKHKLQLKDIVYEPIEESYLLFATSYSKIAEVISSLMSKYECKILCDCKEIDLDVKNKPAESKNSQQYLQWAYNILKKAAVLKTPHSLHSKYITSIQTLVHNLIAFNTALEMLELIQLKDVLHYLESYFHEHNLNKHSTSDENVYYENFLNIQKLLKNRLENENLNLKKLKEMLQQHLLNKGGELCGIIFVRTRALTEYLSSWVNECDDLKMLKAKPFTGTAPLLYHKGMTQSEREHIIKLFDSYEVRLLVSTSAGDEGLDIQGCNLVIMYNYVGNEVSSLQRTGRARKKGGLSILLATEKLYNKEIINKEKKKIMLEAIDKISQMDPRKIQEKNKINQIKLLKKREIKSTEEICLKRKAFKMHCFRCHKYITDNSNVKLHLDTHRVIVDRAVLKQIIVRPMECALNGTDSQNLGKVYCSNSNCINKLGQLIVIGRAPFVALKAQHIVFDIIESEDGQDHYFPFKKWKDVPLLIDDIKENDIKRYKSQESTSNCLDQALIGNH